MEQFGLMGLLALTRASWTKLRFRCCIKATGLLAADISQHKLALKKIQPNMIKELENIDAGIAKDIDEAKERDGKTLKRARITLAETCILQQLQSKEPVDVRVTKIQDVVDSFVEDDIQVKSLAPGLYQAALEFIST